MPGLKMYEVSKDPHGQITCLIHDTKSRIIIPLKPTGLFEPRFDIIGNGGIELAMSMLVHFFNEQSTTKRWEYSTRKSKALKWVHAFYTQVIWNKREAIYTDKDINDFVANQKMAEVIKRLDEGGKDV
jgi:hypothetical protein